MVSLSHSATFLPFRTSSFSPRLHSAWSSLFKEGNVLFPPGRVWSACKGAVPRLRALPCLRRDGGECYGAGGICAALGAPPGAVLGRNTVAREHKPREAGLLWLGLLYANPVLLLKYCNELTSK